jgi:dipeptidyl aminopeptidase/acylaminoacyl peptidase
MSFDPISQDIPYNPDFPAEMREVEFFSGGAKLNGVAYLPAGEGLHPLILLLHGIPGHERNLDLAQIFRRAGYVTVIFHYRGAWGSEGNYRLMHVLEDSRAAIAYFRENAEAFRADSKRIITIGHSLGGWAALLTADAADATASIAGLNLGVWGQQVQENPEMARPMLESLISDLIGPLSGVTVAEMMAEIDANTAVWDTRNALEMLRERKLLLIGAKRDDICPVFDHHMPLAKGLKETAKLVLLPSDHSFADSRIALARELLTWLEDLKIESEGQL